MPAPLNENSNGLVKRLVNSCCTHRYLIFIDNFVISRTFYYHHFNCAEKKYKNNRGGYYIHRFHGVALGPSTDKTVQLCFLTVFSGTQVLQSLTISEIVRKFKIKMFLWTLLLLAAVLPFGLSEKELVSKRLVHFPSHFKCCAVQFTEGRGSLPHFRQKGNRKL